MAEAITIFSAYFIGSLPTTWLIYRWRTGRDLRTVGDGNVGSANAIREGSGWWWGHISLVLDIGKGLFAVSIARWLDLPISWWLVAGYLVLVGHMFPIWLGFNGGRAAATALGAVGAFLPWQFGLTFAAGVVTFLSFPIAELAMIVVVGPLPFLAIVFDLPGAAIAFAFSAPVFAGVKAAFDRWFRFRQSQPLNVDWTEK